MNDQSGEFSRHNRNELLGLACDFLILHHYPELWNAMSAHMQHNWCSLLCDGMKLFAHSQVLGNLLLLKTRDMLDLFDDAVIASQNDLISRLPSEALNVHYRIVVRWHHLPNAPEVFRSTIPKSIDAGKLLMVRGTVVRAEKAKTIEWEVVYQCQSCHGTFRVHADLEAFNLHPYPSSCGVQTPLGAKKCTSKKFEKVSAVSAENARDYQELKVQEQVQHLDMGALPKSICVLIMDQMVGVCNAGDDVTITGLLTHRWGVLAFGVQPELELVLLGMHISVNNERKAGSGMTDELSREFGNFWRDNADTPLLARDALLKSICPEVYGMYNVKLALAMVLAGGVRSQKGNNATRGDAHLLMIGDPGTGKSQLLRFAAKMANRSVLTTGVGTTGAGLTATAVRGNTGEYGLEAGALVLADGGVCCIDEFASIDSEHQAAMHEAMEQQTLDIAKAGIVCKLHTRCSILAATNPKSKYNTDESVSTNVALGGPLLSRFDVVLVLLDEPDEQWDRAISSFILQERSRNIMSTGEKASDVDADEGQTEDVYGIFRSAPQTPNRDTSSRMHEQPSNPRAPNQYPQSPATPHNASTSPTNRARTSPLNTSALPAYRNSDAISVHSSGVSNGGSQLMGLETSNYSRSHIGGGIDLMRDVWPIEKIQAYLSWVRSAFKPTLSADVRLIGQTYYARQRSADIKDAARTTARLAESFVRITQGHAKLMARHVCIIQDAIFAIVLLESSTFSSAIGGQRFPNVRSFFPNDPDLEYLQIEALILNHLGLSNVIKSTGVAPTSVPTTPTPPRVTGDRYDHIPLNRHSEMPHTHLQPPFQTSPPSRQQTSQTTFPLQQQQRPLGSQLPQTTTKGSIAPIPLEFNDSVTESQMEKVAGVTASYQPRPATTGPLSKTATSPTALHRAENTGEPQLTTTRVSTSPMDTHVSDGELIPLPPTMAGEFGVWESDQAKSLKVRTCDPSDDSQMDVDDDFML